MGLTDPNRMTDPNITTEVDADGILLATIDMPGRKMNVFSRSMMDSLSALIERVERDDTIRGVVLSSGKPAFIAGADLAMIKMFAEEARDGDPADLNRLFGHLGRVFRRMELSTKPYVAAINGLALGGGLEVCLACHARVAADHEGVGLGLPEIKLGLLPGAGGTQRLPRLVGTAKGLEMLLLGEPVSARDALSLGLVDEVASSEALINTAKARARALEAPKAPWDRPGFSRDSAPFDFNATDAFDRIAQAVGIGTEQREHYPAYHAIMDCVVGGWNLPMTEASDREMEIFVELMRDRVAGNMVRTLFLNRQAAAKAGVLGKDGVFMQGADALVPMLRAAAADAEARQLETAQKLLALALAALRCWDAGKVENPDFGDVAAVTAGLYPAYTGGPFNWLRQMGEADIRSLADGTALKAPELCAVPEALPRFLNQA